MRRKQLMTRKVLENKLKDLIPQRELAEMLGVTVKTLIDWNKRGYNGQILPKVNIGRLVFYRPADVDRFQKLSGKNATD